MFDYAISKNQRRKPTRRFFASWIASCLAHFMAVLMLIQFPQLLQGGMYHHFRNSSFFSSFLGAKSESEDKNWRTVAILKDPSRMSAPSAATLQKYLYDWNKNKPGTPPVHIRWGDVQAALLADTPPMPRVRKENKESELSLPANEVAAQGSEADPIEKTPEQSGDASQGSSTLTRFDPTSGKNGTITLPPPSPAAISDAAGNTAPSKIPDSIKPSGAGLSASGQNVANSQTTARVFKDEQEAIRSPDSGFFDSKGFPLGEYASLIIERIKGKWFIPSHLRNSQGHTTVIFYIDREGRFTNARIVNSSGSNSLDLAALNAIIESNPAPPLPKGFPGDHVGAKFVFSYNEPQ